MSRAPQDEIYAVVDHTGDLTTGSASKRWAFKEPQSAKTRAMLDQYKNPHQPHRARVARYVFAGWVE